MSNLVGTGVIFEGEHKNLYKDWVIGTFVKHGDPHGLFNTDKFEFKYQHGKKGQYRAPKQVMNVNTTTLAILMHGKVRIKFESFDKDYYMVNEGEYVVWTPDEPHEFEFLEDTLVLTLRWNK